MSKVSEPTWNEIVSTHSLVTVSYKSHTTEAFYKNKLVGYRDASGCYISKKYLV